MRDGLHEEQASLNLPGFGSFVHEFPGDGQRCSGINIPQDGHLYENLKYHLSDKDLPMKIDDNQEPVACRDYITSQRVRRFPAFSILFEKYFA